MLEDLRLDRTSGRTIRGIRMDGISEREFSSSEQYSWRSSRKNCQTSKNQAAAEGTMIKNCERFCGSSDISRRSSDISHRSSDISRRLSDISQGSSDTSSDSFSGLSDISSDSFRVHIGHVRWVLEKKMKIFFPGRSMVLGG